MKRNIFRKKSILLLFLVVFGFQLFAQNPNTFFNKIRKEYPEDSFIQLNKEVRYRISIKEGALGIELIEKEKFIYLKNLKNLPITLNTYSSTIRELVEYDANSYVPDGNKYKKIKVDDFKEKMNVDNRSFYDDIKELTFTFPGVAEGTIIELNTVHKIHEPRLINSVYLNSFIPIREFELLIESDMDIDLETIKINFPDNKYNIEQVQSKKTNIHKCSIKNLEKIIPEDFEPDYSYFISHIIPVIRSYNSDGKTIDILSNTKSLYNWYEDFIADFKLQEEDSEIKQIVDTILIECTTEFEKVEKLYYWVQNNIKYIAFEYGMGGFIPRDPKLTLKNRYGDCKDKTALLFKMLKSAGIKSYFTWIGTYDIPYTYEEVSSPLTDNHMIITYINDGKYYFLDGTGSYLNIEYPNVFIQGKEALVAIDSNNFEIKKVPIINSEKNKIKDIIELEIENDVLSGSGSCAFTGYHKQDLQYGFFRKDEDEQRKIIERNLEKGNP